MVKRLDEITLGLLFGGVPLIFITRAADAFILPKEIIALTALVFLLIRALFHSTRELASDWIIRWALFFLVWMSLDSLAVGLWGTESMKGLLRLFLLVSVITVVVWASTMGVRYEKWIHYSLWAGGLMALLGIAQALGWDGSIHWNTRFGNRVFSTLGNPDYLGGHLAALLPVAFILGWRATKERKKSIWMGITLLMLGALAATKALGAELAFAGSFTFLAFLLFYQMDGEGRVKDRGALILIFAAFLMVGGWAVQRQGSASASVQQRLETWRVTWEMVKDHPWRGIGVGQIGVLYPAYQHRPFQPTEYDKHPYTYTEHVHNEYLQFWAEGGLPGLLLFLALLSVFFISAWKFWKDPNSPAPDKELLAGVTAGVIAVLIQAFSNFPLRIAPTAVVFGLFLAAPVALSHRARGRKEIIFLKVPWAWIGALIFLAFGVRTLAASITYRDMVGENSRNHSADALYYGNKLVTLSPHDDKAWLAYGKVFQSLGEAKGAAEALGKAVELNPNEVEALTAKAQVEIQMGRFEDVAADCAKAEAIAPNDSMPYWFEGAAFFQLNQYEQAARAFDKFLLCVPGNVQAYSNLGVCYIRLGRKAEAVSAWEKGYALHPGDPQLARYLKANGVSLP